MPTCRHCAQTFSTLTDYFEHYHYHSSVLGGALCPCEPCGALFKNYQSLRSHVFRHHKKRCSKQTDDAFVCSVLSCGASVPTRTELLGHIAAHLESGIDAVMCPFVGCGSVLRSAGSFRTHVSRYHRGKTATQCTEVPEIESSSDQEHSSTPPADVGDNCERESGCDSDLPLNPFFFL